MRDTPSYRSGELWVRIGIDGVPMWHSHVATTLSVRGKLKNYKEHTPQRHYVIALYRGYDSQETLTTILQHIKLDEALCKLNGKQMIVQRQHFKVRIFVEGDHMLRYKICGRDGPTTTMVSITWHTKNTPPKQPFCHTHLVVPCAHGI